MLTATIVGARPQLIKAAMVSRALAERGIREMLLHTGQHFDAAMSRVFFDELGLPEPHRNLGIGGGSHGRNTGRMIEALEDVLLHERPDAVLVFGDTDSTLAGALAAVKLQIPVAHVEAGLRSGNRAMPEEINRVLTDHAASLLLAPTDGAVRTLLAEGLPAGRVHNVGDVMYDAALFFAERSRGLDPGALAPGCAPGGYVLATVHRQENTDAPARLAAVMDALGRLARRMPVVLPLHPRTRARLAAQGLAVPRGVLALEPQGYLAMTALQRNAALVVTDSGGIQKEAFFHGVPCVTIRTETEWTELLDLGWNRLADPGDPEAVVRAAEAALAAPPSPAPSPYGTGRSAQDVARLMETISF